MSGRRGVVVAGTALLAALALLLLLRGGDAPGTPERAAPQGRPGPVLLVPGYGGGTSSLERLAQRLRDSGREAVVVPPVGDGTGDLRLSADALGAAAEAARASGAASVDVVGFSAGGVVARLWAKESPALARRVVTLGSPHHGTRLAATGAAFAPGSCPLGCQQLATGSDLLDELNDGDETPDGPRWMSVWTAQDDVVTPPESARLEGAVNVVAQDVCPGLALTHGRLPVDPLVTGLVLEALNAPAFPERAPGSDRCAALQAAGR